MPLHFGRIARQESEDLLSDVLGEVGVTIGALQRDTVNKPDMLPYNLSKIFLATFEGKAAD